MLLSDIEAHTRSEIESAISLRDKIAKFIELFDTVSVVGCNRGNDSDMLLFEWGGPYRWENSKVLSLVRQFTVFDEDGEYEGMKQLHFDCCFSPDLDIGESGNKWLETDTALEFERFVMGSTVFKACENIKPTKFEIFLDDV
jgi:hypothetical protein